MTGAITMGTPGAPRVVFLHSAVGDARMWAPQQRLLADRFETVALDLHEPAAGDGDVAPVDVVSQQLPAILVGNSFGGRVALEAALAFPEQVPALVLVDAAIGDHEWSQAMQDHFAREEALFEAGDLDAVVELNLERWALPHVRDVLRPMQRRAVELEAAGPEGELVWPPSRPLSALMMPTLVIVGEHDVADFHAIARRIAREARDARLEVVAAASHHPSLEQPERFDRLLVSFLASLPSAAARR